MRSYYLRTCRNCGEDCDFDFCSDACQRDYEDGLGDYLYERYIDDKLMDRWEKEVD